MDVASGDERGTTERVLTLLGLLQQRQVWTGPELADRLGVTPRTVRRDVERLRTLGYLVHASQGVGGGYQLGPGQDLPPLLLDDEEAIATAVSLLAGAGGAVAGAGDAALRALTKLDQVLPGRLRHEVRALSGSVESFGGGRPPVDPEVLMTLARACRDEVEAGFDYPSGSEARRRVEPYRLVASDRRWYLLAYDLDRDDWRSFRVDRMTEVSARTWRFRPRAAPDAAAYVQEGVASRVYPHRARFLVHASADTVRAQIPASAAVVRAARERALRGAQWRRQPRLRAHAHAPAGARLRGARPSGAREALSRAGGETAVGRWRDPTGAGHGGADEPRPAQGRSAGRRTGVGDALVVQPRPELAERLHGRLLRRPPVVHHRPEELQEPLLAEPVDEVPHGQVADAVAAADPLGGGVVGRGQVVQPAVPAAAGCEHLAHLGQPLVPADRRCRRRPRTRRSPPPATRWTCPGSRARAATRRGSARAGAGRQRRWRRVRRR